MRSRSPLCLVVLVVASRPLLAGATTAPTVWAIDDGEKIKRDATALPFERGESNPIWSPGRPIRLFALKNETVAFQVVVEAGDASLEGVTIDLDALTTPGGDAIANAAGARDPTRFVGRAIERFVEHFVAIERPSGGRFAGESLGWDRGSGPDPRAWIGAVPDALIPVEVAPAWDPYPMRIAARANGIVWIDITVAKSLPAGVYSGFVVVKSQNETIATLPVELTIKDATLADRPVRTMVYYDRDELAKRIGAADEAEDHLLKLFHRHRLSPMLHASTRADALRYARALDGSLYTRAAGYEGACESMGDGVLALGAYGAYGEPDRGDLADVESIADLLAERGLLASTHVFVYAIDERCDSTYGRKWKELLARATSENARRVRVAWTCDDDAANQPVDVPIQGSFDASAAARARALGKEVWVYNGHRPGSDTFSTDSEAVSPRVNGWLGAMFDIGRWFYWESTFWYDDNKGGRGAYDPFVTSETFHNADGDHDNGNGVLVYPGKQIDVFGEHSIGFDGVVASIRMKNWRRGIEDAGYLQLARRADAARANAIARALIPRAWSEAKSGAPASWSTSGRAFFEARRALFDRIEIGSQGASAPNAIAPPAPAPQSHDRGRPVLRVVALLVVLAVVLSMRLRRRTRA
jgi:hypothetical protein